MNVAEVKQKADVLSLAEQAGAKFHKSGGVWQSACPLHKGDGAQAFNVFPDNTYYCFSHSECNEFGNDAIAFVRAWQNKSFRDAVAFLGGEVGEWNPKEKEKPVQRAVQLVPGKEWQENAWKIIDRASDFLLEDEAGFEGRKYLLGRGISKATMYRNLLGFTLDCPAWKGRPAIVIPHFLNYDTIVAIKYRFTDGRVVNGKESRFLFQEGGKHNLFGIQHRLDSDSTLLFVEGELNALSIEQLMPAGVTVLSSGSETVSEDAQRLLGAAASKYRRIIIWMDDLDKSEKIREAIGRPDAELMFSKITDKLKWDGNMFLQAGLLESYLTRKLSIKCDYR